MLKETNNEHVTCLIFWVGIKGEPPTKLGEFLTVDLMAFLGGEEWRGRVERVSVARDPKVQTKFRTIHILCIITSCIFSTCLYTFTYTKAYRYTYIHIYIHKYI